MTASRAGEVWRDPEGRLLLIVQTVPKRSKKPGWLGKIKGSKHVCLDLRRGKTFLYWERYDAVTLEFRSRWSRVA